MAQGPLAPQLQFVPPPVPPVHIRTYQDFYSTVANNPNPTAEDNQNAADCFAAPVQGHSRYAAAALAERVADSSNLDLPLAFVCHCRNVQDIADVGAIQVFHRITQFPTAFMGPVQPWDGLTLAITGDVVNQAYYLAPFPAGNFGLAPQGSHVLPDDDTLAACLLQPATLLPATDDQTPNAIEVRTRFTMWVPFSLVPLLLPAPLPPKTAFRHVYEYAQSNNMVVECRPLLDFLKVAATATGAAIGGSAVSRAWPTLPQPPNAALLTFFDRMVSRDLAQWRASAPDTTAYNPVVEALDRLTVQQRETQNAALDRSRAQEQPVVKTPTASFGRQPMERICRFCQVADEAQLPPLWLELANTPKHSRVSVTQQAFDTMKNLLGHLPFTVLATVPLVAKLTSATFDTTDPDDLAQGIGPFQFGLVTPTAATQLAHQVQMYQLIHGGGAQPTLADTNTLSAPDKVQVATNFQMVRESFGGLGLALAVILGVNHQIVTYLSNLLRDLDYKHQALVNQMTHHQPRLPILLQRYVQVQLYQWYQDQGRSTVPLEFGLERVVVLAANGMYNWVATLPYHLTTSPAVGPPRTLAPPPMYPPATTGGDANPRADTGGIQNPGYNSMFDTLRARPKVTSKDVRAHCRATRLALPLDDQGKVRCLPYHIKGQCNNGCGSSHDHHNRHNSAEQARLLEWGTLHWVLPS